MKKNTKFKEYLLELWISVFIGFVNFRGFLINLKSHNGVSVFDYPESSWNLVPFPAQKGDVFNADNLATVNRHEFLADLKFINARNAAESRWGKPKSVRDISWRLHVVLWAYGLAIKNRNAEDAICVECGTGRGYMAAGIAEFHQINGKSPNFYLIDTFTSHLVSSSGNAVISPASFAYSDGDEEVNEYFSRYECITTIKGLIPEALKQLPDAPISFLHIDLNNTNAEAAALSFLKDRLITGSIIIFDDYGGPGGQDQAIMHEKFAISVNKDLLILPTGQAVIIW
jgi:O-methyltransferase